MTIDLEGAAEFLEDRQAIPIADRGVVEQCSMTIEDAGHLTHPVGNPVGDLEFPRVI